MGEKNEHVCPVEKAGGLDSGIRKLLQRPKKILGNYVESGMTVLDLGCGPGFFSVEVAEMVGASGKVIAVDMQEGMLRKLESKIQGTEIEKRIKLHKCDKDKIGITEKVDLVLAFYMFHEVPDQKKFLGEIKSMLKPKGEVFIVEPKFFHVSRQAFEETVKMAKEIRFKPVERPKVFLSRAVVFRI